MVQARIISRRTRLLSIGPTRQKSSTHRVEISQILLFHPKQEMKFCFEIIKSLCAELVSHFHREQKRIIFGR
jgi:hypothetical protein